MTDVETASEFLTTLKDSHPSIDFTMELQRKQQASLCGNECNEEGFWLDTKVYKKWTDRGPLL